MRSVPEIIEDGVTGFIVDDVDAAVDAVRHAVRLDRRMVRSRFEERFTAERMARDYLAVYEELLSGAFGGRGSERKWRGRPTESLAFRV